MTTTARKNFPSETQRLALRARAALSTFSGPRKSEARSVPPPEIQAAYRILNFALRAGAAMLSSGAATIEVESAILDLTEACGLGQCETDVTFTSMTATYIQGDDVEPVTAVRVVRQRAVDYGRLTQLSRLRSDLVAGRITPEEAIPRLDEICSVQPRGQWVVLASWAGMAAAFTVLLGGGWLAGVTAFVSSALVTLLMGAVGRYGIPYFFQSALGAAVATGIAMAVVAAHAPVQPPTVVAGGIMVLVPGYALVASVRDAITGFPISGSARGMEVLLTAVGIVTGVAITLYLAVHSGVVPGLGSLKTPFVQSVVQVVAAGVASTLYATAALVPRSSLAYAGLAGAGGWAAVLWLTHEHVSLIVGTAVAAILIGGASAILARRQRSHPFLYMVPGMMPLVPGLTMYQGMLDLFTGSTAAVATLFHALAVGLTIAAAVTLGEMIVRPLRTPSRHGGGAHRGPATVPIPIITMATAPDPASDLDPATGPDLAIEPDLATEPEEPQD